MSLGASWADLLGVREETRARIEHAASAIGVELAIVLRSMAEAVIELDADLVRRRLPGLRAWRVDQGSERSAPAHVEGWDAVVGLSQEQAREFRRLAEDMGLGPAEALRLMVECAARVVHQGREFGGWHSPEGAMRALRYFGLRGLPLRIRPTGLMWPSDQPFPWTCDEAMAALHGYAVHWPGSPDQFFQLRGRWEMDDGRAFLWNT